MGKSKTKVKTKKVLDDEDVELEIGAGVEQEAAVEFDEAAEEEPVGADEETVDIDLDDLNFDAADEVEAEEEPDADVEMDDDAKSATSDGEIVAEDDMDALKAADDEDDEKDDDDEDDDDDEPSVDEPPPDTTPRTSKLAIFLIILNWIAAPLFLTCAFLDHTARAKTAYVALQNHVGIWGLPLKQEENAESLYEQTRPVYRLSPDQLKAEFLKRPNAEKGAATDGFKEVNEPVPLRLRPSDMTEDLQRDLFGSTPRVATLDDEILRLKAALPDLIKEKADEVLKKQKNDEEKREVVRKTLVRIAWNVKQVENLDKRLNDAAGAALDNLVKEAVQRRLYYDILAPYNVFRPDEVADSKKYKVEKISDLDTYKTIDAVKEMLDDRFDSVIADEFKEVHLGKIWAEHKANSGRDDDGKPLHSLQRDSIEKRQTIGFLMFAIAHASVPTLNEKLLPKGLERANTVCGFYEFTNASINYVLAMRFLEERQIAAVKADRQGYVMAYKDKPGLTRTDGFIDEYEKDVDRLVKLAELVETAKSQLKDFESQRDQAQQTYVVRAQQHADALKKLLKARTLTQETAEQLRTKQQDLHKALVELSDAGTINFVLEAELRAIETRFMNAQEKKEKKKR